MKLLAFAAGAALGAMIGARVAAHHLARPAHRSLPTALLPGVMAITTNTPDSDLNRDGVVPWTNSWDEIRRLRAIIEDLRKK